VEGSEQGFERLWWGFVLAAAALAAFVLVERRMESPLLPFDLFRRRNFSVANAETFLVYGSLGGLFLFLPIYLQFLGFTPFEAGLFSVPPSIVLILLAARFGALADRHGPRLYLTLGPAAFGVGALLLLPISSRDEFWTYGIAAIAFQSIGLAMLVAPITATSIASAPERYAGIASGVNTTLSRLGGLLAVAVIGLVISLVFESNGGTESAVPLAVGQTDAALRDASVSAFRAGMAVAVGLAFAGAVLGAVGISNADARRNAEHEPDSVDAGER
jgi:MFS family permease